MGGAEKDGQIGFLCPFTYLFLVARLSDSQW